MKRLLLPLLAVAFILTGCGHPLIPAAKTRSTPPTTPGPATIGSVDVTAKPLLGVDLYGIRNYPPAKARRYGERMLAYIKNTLKANAVGILWNFYTPTRTSNSVITTASDTLSVTDVKILTEIAKEDGLTVYYRPLIFVQNQEGADPWEGKIRATDPAAWFNSYYQVELPYLEAAQQLGVTEFVAATEMHYMNEDPGWTPFFEKVSKVYHGTVSFATYEEDYFPPTHLQDLAAVGMDMYKAMPNLRPSASAAAVLAGWERYFDQMPASVLERTTIQEIGIEARAGAYGAPQDLGAPGKLDEKVQVSWFTAACEAVKHYDMRGLFYFKVDLADVPASPAKSLSTFEGKRGAQAIAACASILG
jgi:hypothetical protein